MTIDTKMSTQQIIQDEEYLFPYHYVSQFRNGLFSQCFNDTWGINYVSTIEFILDEIRKHNAQSMIDLGCGDGRLTRELKTSYPEKKVIGIDYSKKAISLARAMNTGLDIDFKNLDILNETPHPVDLILLIEVFEHIPLDLCFEFMEATSKLLKHGGVLLMTVPHKNKKLEYKHFQHFDINSLSKFFPKSLKIEEVIYFEKNNFLYRALKKILTNRWFILNHLGIRNKIYSIYKNYFFKAEERNCNRIFIKAIKR
jgi:2-polyprenyl-3-methyl-5-hydroxy-6-metoxy-1,4-benzoquinol methylase